MDGPFFVHHQPVQINNINFVGQLQDLEITIDSTHEDVISTSAHSATDQTVHELNINNTQQRKSIAEIVRNKNLNDLRSFGGIKGVAKALNSDLENGISISPQQILHNSHHPNQLYKFLVILYHSFLKASNNCTIFLLSIAAILSLAFGVDQDDTHGFGWFNGTILISIVILIIAVTTIHNCWQEWTSVKKLDNSWHSNLGVLTVRGGNEQLIGEIDLLVGDIVILRTGCQVPGDGLFVITTGDQPLELNDGSANRITTVDENNPFMFYGSRVVIGDAKMLVTSTRMDTVWGEMMSQAILEEPNSKLEYSIHNLNMCVHISGLLISILIIIVLFLRYKVAGKMDDERKYRPDPKGEPTRVITITDAIMGIVRGTKGTAGVLTTLLSLSLLGITEGLPVVISFATIKWCRKMLANKATARGNLAFLKLASVTTIICTERFGGLTEHDEKKKAVSMLLEVRVRTIIASEDDVYEVEDIGGNCGLIASSGSEEGHDLVITGEEFMNWSDEERTGKLDKIRVIGKCLQSHKILLIECLQKNGHVVAFLGQRTIDAPVLKQADIGLTFWTWSSEIAREFSDITIWDLDCFGFMVDAIRSGRCFQDSIGKFIQLHLIFTISLGDAPITPVQLFWLNLVVSLFGGLGLLTGTSSSSTVPAGAKLISKAMWRNIIIQAIYKITICVTLQLKGQAVLGTSRIKSAIFNGFFLCQLFNLFIAREPEKKNIFGDVFRTSNFWFWVALVVFVMCQGVFGVAERVWGSSSGLSFQLWGTCLLIGLLSLLLDFAGKCAMTFCCKVGFCK